MQAALDVLAEIAGGNDASERAALATDTLAALTRGLVHLLLGRSDTTKAAAQADGATSIAPPPGFRRAVDSAGAQREIDRN